MSTDKGKITSFFSPVTNNKGSTKKEQMSGRVGVYIIYFYHVTVLVFLSSRLKIFYSEYV